MGKDLLELEEFAKKIVDLAAEDGLTVVELRRSADLAKMIANNSLVEKGSKDRAYLPSHRAQAEQNYVVNM